MASRVPAYQSKITLLPPLSAVKMPSGVCSTTGRAWLSLALLGFEVPAPSALGVSRLAGLAGSSAAARAHGTARPSAYSSQLRRFHGSPAQPAAFEPPPSAAAREAPSNPQLAFPCLDSSLDRQRKLAQAKQQQQPLPGQPPIVLPGQPPQAQTSVPGKGPEPVYSRIVSGYNTFHYPHAYRLVHGGVLPEFDLAYETWGRLNERRDNAILIHTGLSASSHAKSHERNRNPGWWEKFIGPGLPLDTNRFFIICTNVLGGCYGSTGPSSVDPSNNERYATRFPVVTIFDMVRAQFKMLDAMGIDRLHASVGASMGGMQSLAAACVFPDRVGRMVTISACARSHPYSIAMRYTQRQGGHQSFCFFFVIPSNTVCFFLPCFFRFIFLFSSH